MWTLAMLHRIKSSLSWKVAILLVPNDGIGVTNSDNYKQIEL